MLWQRFCHGRIFASVKQRNILHSSTIDFILLRLSSEYLIASEELRGQRLNEFDGDLSSAIKHYGYSCDFVAKKLSPMVMV